MNPNKTFVNFFIVGYPRSGTTMVASLLARHSNIYIPPETDFFRTFLKQVESIGDVEQLVYQFFQHNRLKDLPINPDTLRHLISDKKFQKQELLGIAIQDLATKHNKTTIGEKTPIHLLYYREILNAYPRTKFVVVIRDGRDCVLSAIKESWAYSNPLQHAAEWNYYIDKYDELLTKVPNQTFLIKYEHILTKPEENTRLLTEYLGEMFEKHQLQASSNCTVVPNWETKWKAKARHSIDSGNMYKWMRNADKRLLTILTVLMYKNLSRFNYDCALIEKINGFERLMIKVRYFPYTPMIYPIIKRITSTHFYALIKSFIQGRITP